MEEKLLYLRKMPRETEKALLPLKNLNIEVTQRCNLKCKHCIASAGPSAKDELSTEEILGVIRQANSIKVGVLGFTGGEPFVREDICILIKEVKKLPFGHLTIFTNGTLLKDEHFHLLKQMGEKIFIQISLDGASPKTHDGIRGVPGAFKKTMKAIRLIKENKIPARIATTFMNENFGEIPDIIKLAKKMGIQWVGGTTVPGGRAIAEDTDPLVQRVLSKKIPKVKIKIRAPKFFKYFPCLGGFRGATIFYDGKVGICPGTRDLIFGDLRTQSLSEIWENKFSIWQRRVDFSKAKNCSSCEYLLLCCGACFAGGELFAPKEIGKRPFPAACAWARYTAYYRHRQYRCGVSCKV